MRIATASLAALLALALASPAVAQLNLSWDDCGAAGKELKTWSCDANPAVVASFYASFVVAPPVNITQLTGMEGVLDVYAAGGVLPAWWELMPSGSCRPTGLTVDFLTPCAGAIDYWSTVAGGPMGGFLYDRPAGIPGQARLRTVQAIDFTGAGPVGPGQYYGFTVTLKGVGTVGTGACAGCSTPVGIVLRQLTLTQPVGVGDYVFNTPYERQWVEWQCPGFPLAHAPGFFFDCVTPAKPRTWGQVKALYR